MAIHKLNIDDFDEVDYEVIAIHTTLEDFRLAYLTNQKLELVLHKTEQGIHTNTTEGETCFSSFVFEDNKKHITWTLIQNKSAITLSDKKNSQNLFGDASFETSRKVYLLPEFKKVDYLLKIENIDATFDVAEITNALNSIDRITTVYNINFEQIKSKNNLIF